MKRALPFLAALIASPALAQETRQLGAHEHGVGELNIAVEGNIVAIELHAPGADIVGFEYEATTAEDRAELEAAVAALARPLDLFVMPEAAACTVTRASAELEGDHDEEEHDHEEHAGDHGEHDQEEHASEAGHSEFHAEYLLTCASPEALTRIEFAYFDRFENARELEVQIVTPAGAQAFDVKRADPVLDLRGLF